MNFRRSLLRKPSHSFALLGTESPFRSRCLSHAIHDQVSSFFSEPYALFCVPQIPIFFLFIKFRTLLQKHREWSMPSLVSLSFQQVPDSLGTTMHCRGACLWGSH